MAGVIVLCARTVWCVIRMRDKISTVPGPKHVVIQALLEYYITDTCPKNYTVLVYKEHFIEYKGKT